MNKISKPFVFVLCLLSFSLVEGRMKILSNQNKDEIKFADSKLAETHSSKLVDEFEIADNVGSPIVLGNFKKAQNIMDILGLDFKKKLLNIRRNKIGSKERYGNSRITPLTSVNPHNGHKREVYAINGIKDEIGFFLNYKDDDTNNTLDNVTENNNDNSTNSTIVLNVTDFNNILKDLVIAESFVIAIKSKIIAPMIAKQYPTDYDTVKKYITDTYRTNVIDYLEQSVVEPLVNGVLDVFGNIDVVKANIYNAFFADLMNNIINPIFPLVDEATRNELLMPLLVDVDNKLIKPLNEMNNQA